MDNAYKEIIIKKQRSFFESGKTLPVGYRIMALKKLGRAIRNYESRIIDALHEDLGKSEMEAFMCEVGISLSEISYMLCHIQTYAAPRIVPTPITNFPSISTVYKCS